MTFVRKISIAGDFSKYPGGRLIRDGVFSGEAFRENMLAPALMNGKVEVSLDGVLGFSSAFLEEAFGSLISKSGFTLDRLKDNLTVTSSKDESLVTEIWEYINNASKIREDASSPIWKWVDKNVAPRGHVSLVRVIGNTNGFNWCFRHNILDTFFYVLDQHGAYMVFSEKEYENFTMKKTLDGMINALVFNAAEATAAKQSGDKEAEKKFLKQIDQGRANIHDYVGSIDMNERARLNRIMKG